jgi:hypothetical protein
MLFTISNPASLYFYSIFLTLERWSLRTVLSLIFNWVGLTRQHRPLFLCRCTGNGHAHPVAVLLLVTAHIVVPPLQLAGVHVRSKVRSRLLRPYPVHSYKQRRLHFPCPHSCRCLPPPSQQATDSLRLSPSHPVESCARSFRSFSPTPSSFPCRADESNLSSSSPTSCCHPRCLLSR